MPEGDEADIVLRGVVRVENIESPEQYIPRLLSRVKKEHLERTYEVGGWNDEHEFLALLGRKGGRLLKGGEVDEAAGTQYRPSAGLIVVAKMVINDFLRGKIPWYIPDPNWPERKPKDMEAEEFEGRQGRLGEMRPRGGGEHGGDDESWDGLDVESDDEGDSNEGHETDGTSEVDDDELESGEEEERIEDPRPRKKQKKVL